MEAKKKKEWKVSRLPGRTLFSVELLEANEGFVDETRENVFIRSRNRWCFFWLEGKLVRRNERVDKAVFEIKPRKLEARYFVGRERNFFWRRRNQELAGRRNTLVEDNAPLKRSLKPTLPAGEIFRNPSWIIMHI